LIGTASHGSISVAPAVKPNCVTDADGADEKIAHQIRAWKKRML
jgi:hypothetical protein